MRLGFPAMLVRRRPDAVGAGGRDASARVCERREAMTLIWFVVWLIANSIGDHEPLKFDPVNAWAATLLLALALDVNRSQVYSRRRR
jgi:hypothetical protein